VGFIGHLAGDGCSLSHLPGFDAQDRVLGYSQPELSKLANQRVWCRHVGFKENQVGLDDCLWYSLEFRFTQDVVLGNSQPSLRDWSRWVYLPRTTPEFLYAALDRSLRRLSSQKAARGSVVPPSGAGNPGPSWATFSRPSGTFLELQVLTQRIDTLQTSALLFLKVQSTESAFAGVHQLGVSN
jgi:hypothetical protein